MPLHDCTNAKAPSLIQRASSKSVHLAPKLSLANGENVAPTGEARRALAGRRDHAAFTRRLAADARAQAPALPADALLRIAQQRAAFGDASVDAVNPQTGALHASIARAQQHNAKSAAIAPALLRPPARHWLRALLLQDGASSAKERAQADALVDVLRAPEAQACVGGQGEASEGAQAFPRLDQVSYKFAPSGAMHRRLRLPGDVGVREMFGRHGYLFVSNTLVNGAFGKFRVARNLDGKVFAVKEFRTEQAAAYLPHHDPRRKRAKTRVSDDATLRAEVDAIARYGEGTTLFGDMVWRGKYYLMMTLFARSAVGIGELLDPQAQDLCAMLLLRDVGGQLARLHDGHGVVHRDVKLDNILIDYQGKPYLSDFGMTVPFNAPGTHICNDLMGTHFAPELILEGSRGAHRAYTPQSDIFALGASLLEIWLPEFNNPFLLRAYPRGFDLACGRGGYAAYQAWHQSTRDASGTVDPNKFGAHDFGRFFTFLAEATPLASFVLTYLLHPDPACRLSAREAASDAARYLRHHDNATLYGFMKKLPASDPQRAALAALKRYHKLHTALQTA